jgi:hypothetical protein
MDCSPRRAGLLLLFVVVGVATSMHLVFAQMKVTGTLSKVTVDVYSVSRCQDGAIQRDTTRLVLPPTATETAVDIACPWATLIGKITLQIPDVPITGTLC